MKFLTPFLRNSKIHSAFVILLINLLTTPFGRAELVEIAGNREATIGSVQIVASSGNTEPVIYDDLGTAFAAINDGTHQGNISITISASTTETTTALLNASGTGSANYTSVIVSPTVANITISGDLNAPLIRLTGADYVTFEGIVNGSGTSRDLSIINENTGSEASVIEFIEGATHNNLRYCNLSGSNAIISVGASDNLNSTNTIEQNAIADFLNPGFTSNGISLGPFNAISTISYNYFYQSEEFIAAADVEYSAIRISAGSNNGFVIEHNTIGGSDLNGTGNWIKSGGNTPFFGIYFSAGNDVSNIIQENIIHNFQWTNSGNANWSGIHIQGGSALVSSNTIGAATGIGNIQVILGAATAPSNGVFGISHASVSPATFQNNLIGSITSNNSNPSNATNIYGIIKLAYPSQLTIIDNEVSRLEASSISSGSSQSVIGITYEVSGGSAIISANTVSDLLNLTTYFNGKVRGIQTDLTSNTIINNVVNNLSTPSPNSANGINASVIGILTRFTNSAQQVSGNTIHTLSNTSAALTRVIGIYIKSSLNLNNRISENFIYNLSVATVKGGAPFAEIFGISKTFGSATFSNNIINLGVGVTSNAYIYGIYDPGNGTNNVNYFFNTIFIGGTSFGADNNSYALFVSDNKTQKNIFNNVFHNERTSSGTVSYHCAVHYQINADGLNADYNVYYYPHGVFARIGPPSPATFLNTLADWQLLYPSQDIHSLVDNSNFSLPGGPLATNYIPVNPHNGIEIPGIPEDYLGKSRVCEFSLGAFEVTSASAQFILGPASTRCQGIESVLYLTNIQNASSFIYNIDAVSLANQVTINSSTGEVTYPATWLGITTITITANGCDNTTTTATHLATTQGAPGFPAFTLGATSLRYAASESVFYTATAAYSTNINYSIDTTSLASGVSINAGTGEVTYPATWIGTTYITATATGNCEGPAVSVHKAYILDLSQAINVETFDNLNIGASYATGTFSGVNNHLWQYSNSRGDVSLVDKAITLQNDTASLVCDDIINGMETLSFKFMQASVLNVNLNILVNGVFVANITSDNQEGLTLNSGILPLNLTENIKVEFIVNSGGGEVTLDDISWYTRPVNYTTFSGTGNWSDITKWDNGIPDANTNATINGEVTLDMQAFARETTINPFAKLTLQNRTLTAEKIVIKSDVSGTGSVVSN